MKAYLYFLFFSIITSTNCNVTERVIHFSVESNESTSNNNTLNIPKDNHKIVEEELNNVHLSDILLKLRKQDWSDEEKPCLDHIYKLLYGLQNFTLWAVWNWDAQSLLPQGVLFGSRYQLGNFDQCMNPPWPNVHQELRPKYCLAEVVLQRNDKPNENGDRPSYPYQSAWDYMEYQPPHTRPLNEMTWGICVPVSCGPRTLERLLGVLLSRSHFGAADMRANISITEPCQLQGSRRDFDALFFAFIVVIGALALICLFCTYLNYRGELTANTKKTKFIQAFCLKENLEDLFRTKKEAIKVFYGIRYLTMCLIVINHQLGIFNAAPISDGVQLDKDVQSPLGLLVLHNDLFVDTFFLLSGFLAMTDLAKFKNLPNPLLMIFRRYVRLVIALALVVFFVCALFPYMGSGPLWNRATQETTLCRQTWWLNLLMVNNYINTEHICIVASWYIPCDFHFFVVTVLVYYIYRSHPRLGLVVAALLALGSVLLPGIITYVYELSPIQPFTYEFVIDPRSSKDFHTTYIKSHMRYSTYLIGFLSGYIFVYGATGAFKKIKKKWLVLVTLFLMLFMLAVMMMGGSYLWRSFHPMEGAIYAALNRPVWAGAVALLGLCCAFYIPWVKSFLGWYPWVPLSRLAYGLYLTHTVLITRNEFVARNPKHNDYFKILNSAIGVIFWSTGAAFVLWMLAESPTNKILALCLNSKIKKSTATETSNQDMSSNTSISSMPTDSLGHLQDNLPSTIHYSTKI